MGTYWEPVCLELRERLGTENQPFAAKDGEWVWSLASRLLTHLLLGRWRGRRVEFVCDEWDASEEASDAAYHDKRCRNIWPEVFAEFCRTYWRNLSEWERSVAVERFGVVPPKRPTP